MGTLRVVLDTNILLSGIAYPTSIPGKILAAWRHGSLEVLLSGYVTGDKDLLDLSVHYPVIAPAAFWGKHGAI
ncbi:MAG TPA: hypothetical protein VMV63_00095 [Acidithiobacillus sp.]|nr:hypothetical protein [Acidithiobacillus sp.]